MKAASIFLLCVLCFNIQSQELIDDFKPLKYGDKIKLKFTPPGEKEERDETVTFLAILNESVSVSDKDDKRVFLKEK